MVGDASYFSGWKVAVTVHETGHDGQSLGCIGGGAFGVRPGCDWSDQNGLAAKTCGESCRKTCGDGSHIQQASVKCSQDWRDVGWCIVQLSAEAHGPSCGENCHLNLCLNVFSLGKALS